MLILPRVNQTKATKQSPIPKAGLALWLRADRGIVLDNTSTPTVATWQDQSGLGNHATQATKTSQPRLITNSANGKPAVRFVTGFLTCPLVNTGPVLEAYTVFKRLGNGSSGVVGLLSFSSNTSIHDYDNASSAIVFLDQPSTGFGSYRVSALSTASARLDNVPVLCSSVFDGALNTLTYNNIAASPVASTGSFNYNKGYIGSRYTFSTSSDLYNGEMCELLVYHRTLSTSERNKVNSYLKVKYAV